ncbi:Tetratricopeptide-like helical [Penicillium longicatenatum]|nr:Tetratricopeptide-like helical [Penicillium longicatenatum]
MTSISFGGANSGSQVGINNGTIHLPPKQERPETPPLPLSTVPFRRDRDYVDRGTLPDEIYEKGTTPGARIALVGLGGVGKSQLAIELSYRIREKSPQTWVLWIHAGNAARFEQDCRDIADRVRIAGWLADERNGKWVVMLDNVDDSRFLHEVPPSGQPILAYFPITLNGSMIITSRSSGAISSIVEGDDTFSIEPIDSSQATVLFEKKLGAQAEKESIIQLVTTLDCIPLAIVQAAAYIKQRMPRLSVSQYLKEFQKSDRIPAKLLQRELLNESDDNEESGTESSIDEEFEDNILVLRDYSMISISVDGATFEMHRTRLFGPRHETTIDSLEMVGGAYTLYGKWKSAEVLELQVIEYRKQVLGPEHPDTLVSMYNLAFTYQHQGRWKEAEELNVQVMRARTQVLGVDHYQTLNSMHNLASICQAQNRWKEAEELYVRVIKAREQVLGPMHPDTLVSTSGLASTYRYHGRFQEAEKLWLHVMEARKQVLGPEHPNTLVSMNNLAITLKSSGRIKAALHLMAECCRLRILKLGPDDSRTIYSMSTLNKWKMETVDDWSAQSLEPLTEI